MTAGYEAAKGIGDVVGATVQKIAVLIGEPHAEPVTLESGETVVGGLGLREDAAALSARARDLRQGLFTIIVVGEFKNGKSTLLNAMLGSKTLPAKAAPATAIITALVNGDREDVAIYETGKPHPRRVTWEEFVCEFQLSPQDQETIQERGALDRFSHIEYAEIERNHALCALGVKLIDSPGLGEHVSRTRVATNFLKRAQAIILVLNATRILTRDERIFIETMLGEGRLDHVFFVVNRINQVDPDSVQEIKAWVESQLEPHFRHADGTFDRSLFRRRVFFVNARGALEARGTVPNDDSALASSGVPALEEEIERFLTSEEKIAATLHSTERFLRPVMSQARERIEQARSALDAPLDELEQRQGDARVKLEELEARKRETERTILLFGDAIKQKVFADLRAFIEELPNTWDEDSRRLMDLDRVVSLRNVITAYAQKEARDRMAVAISEEVQRYVQTKFTAWSDRIPAVLENDTAALLGEIEAQIDDLQLELDRIAAAFAGTSRRNREGGESARMFQLALSLGEISGITEDVLAVGDLNGMLGRLVQQSIIGFILSTLMQSSFLMATIMVEVVQAGLSESEVKRRIRQKLGERLIKALRDQVNEKREFVYSAIQERFTRLAENAAMVVGAQIEEVRTEQERIIEQKRDSLFSVDREKARLDAIEAELGLLQTRLAQATGSPIPTAR